MLVTAVLFDLDNTLLDRQRSLDGLAVRPIRDFSDRLIETGTDHLQKVLSDADGNGYRSKTEALPRISTELGVRQRSHDSSAASSCSAS